MADHDPNVRETYHLPDRAPVAYRHWLLMVGMVVAALVLWVVLPDSAISVVLIALLLLGAVFLGVQRVLSSRAISETPGRNPTQPPSTESH
jgi:hypothetical protein